MCWISTGFVLLCNLRVKWGVLGWKLGTWRPPELHLNSAKTEQKNPALLARRTACQPDGYGQQSAGFGFETLFSQRFELLNTEQRSILFCYGGALFVFWELTLGCLLPTSEYRTKYAMWCYWHCILTQMGNALETLLSLWFDHDILPKYKSGIIFHLVCTFPWQQHTCLLFH